MWKCVYALVCVCVCTSWDKKRSNSHDCRKLKFISKVRIPSHHTHATSSQSSSISDASQMAVECVCVCGHMCAFSVWLHNTQSLWTMMTDNYTEGKHPEPPRTTSSGVFLQFCMTFFCCWQLEGYKLHKSEDQSTKNSSFFNFTTCFLTLFEHRLIAGFLRLL